MNDTTTAKDTDAAEIESVVKAARDSMSDDMVARIAENATQALDLVDRVNRSGVAQALPAIAELVANGDLERLVRIARVYAAAEDAVTDHMLESITETTAAGLELLDRVNRLNLGKALPVLERLVESGDLERIAHYARVAAAAEDALSDDIVGRFAEVAAEGVTVFDQLSRSGVGKLIDLLDKMNSSGTLDTLAEKLPRLVENMEVIEKMLGCVAQAAEDVKDQPPPSGGLFPLLAMVRDPANQAFMQFAFAMGRRMKESCAKG